MVKPLGLRPLQAFHRFLPAMPFTFAHPAAVVPLYRLLAQRLVLSAMIVGSMVPDFQYFLPFNVDRQDSHSVAGIFWFCLPVAMVLYLVYHLLLKRPMLSLLPPFASARLAFAFNKQHLLPRTSGFSVVMSLLIGILTHLAWDAFTHYGYLSVFILPFLTAHVFSVGDYHVYPYKILQHASTVIGAYLLWRWAVDWLHKAPVASLPHTASPEALSPSQRIWVSAVLLTVSPVIGLLLAVQTWHASYGLMEANEILREAVVVSISVFGVLLLAYSMVWHLFFLRRNSRPEQ